MNIRKSAVGLSLLTLLSTGASLAPSHAFALVPTTVTGAVMLDTDHNGRLDHVDVTFSGALDVTSLSATDFTVDTCTFFTPAFPVTAAVSSGANTVSLTITEEAAGQMDTGVVCAVTVNGVLDASGSPADGTVTATDGAGPVIRTIDYTDDNWNGKIDRLIVRYSEELNAASALTVSDFAIGNAGDFTGTTVAAVGPDGETGALSMNASMGWVSVPLTEGLVFDTCEESGVFSLDTAATYSLRDVTGNLDANIGSQPQAVLNDLAKPLMKSVEYLDGNTNGRIDSIRIQFTEPVTSDSTLTENQVVIAEDGGFTGLVSGTGTTDLIVGRIRRLGPPSAVSYVTVDLTESSVVLTAAVNPFSITFNPEDTGFLLIDQSNNQSSANNQPYTSLEVIDGAAVIVASTTPAAGGSGVNVDTDITVVFSEPMNISSGSAITLSPAVAAAASFNQDGLTYVINPDSSLANSTVYTVSFGEGIDSVNTDPAAGSLSDVSFTTRSTQGSGSAGYIAPNLPGFNSTPAAPTPTPTLATPAPQVLGTTDTAVAVSDANGVMAGDYIRGTTWSTVYYVSEDMNRHVFIDEQTYFTYRDSWDGVKVLPDAALASYPMGALMLPKAGTVLVKIESATEVYALENNAAGQTILRQIPNEMTAQYVFGARWADYVIDVSPAFYKKFVLGQKIDTSFPVNMANMKTRAALNSH